MDIKNASSKSISNTWYNQRKKARFLESLVVGISASILIFCIVCDIEVMNNVVRMYVDNFESFVLELLGVQATVSTLTIALVALISNNISESYMGIAVSDYYLNIRPYLFKQNVIIFASLVLIVVSCFFYLFSLYNLVIGLFIVTIILVVFSSYEIYFLFRGLQKAKEEISLYVSESIVLSSNNNKNRIFSDFINDWSHEVNRQIEIEYRKHKTIFINTIENTICSNSLENVCLIKELCRKQICCCLEDSSTNVKARGVELLGDAYDTLWNIISNHNFQKEQIAKFRLFDEVLFPFYEALKGIPLNMLEKVFDWEHFTDMVSRTAFNSVLNDGDNTFIYELECILRLSGFIGYILKVRERQEKESFENSLSYWGRCLSQPYLDSAFNITNDQAENYLKFRCKKYFYYAKGFIDNQYIKEIKENIYFKAISNTFYSINKYEILYYLSIDCYLYYLSEKESISCIDVDIKSSARQILEDKNVISLNDFLLSKIDVAVLEYKELEEHMQDMLTRCEWFPKYDNGKTMIMENVVREFFVFMQLLMNNRYRYGEQKKYSLKELPFVYINQFLEGNEANTKKNIKRFCELFQPDTSNLDDTVNAMYNELEKYLKELYKKCEIEKANQEEKEYHEKVDESAVIKAIQDKLKSNFNNTFGSLSKDIHEETISWTSTINLINCNLLTYMINEDTTDEMYSNINAAFVSNIASELIKRDLLKKTTRDMFKDDAAFVEFMQEKKFKTFLGSEYIFKNIDYQNKKMFDDFFNNSNCIFYGFYQNGGIALFENSLKVKVENVKVTIRPVSLDDIEYHAEESNEMLSYNITNNIMIPFQKNELIVYIANKRKMLSVSVKLEFTANKQKIGSYIIRKNI